MSGPKYKFHDKSYKKLFSHPKMIQDLLEGFVSEDFVKEVNFEELTKLNVSFISESYKEREADLVVKLKFKEKEIYFYILISFQSTPDKFMALRSLSYILLFYQELIDQGKVKGKLPPVFPIVLYTGKTKYTSAVQIEDLIFMPSEGLMKYIPKYEYFKIEVKPDDKEGYEELIQQDNVAAACFNLVTSKNKEEFKESGKIVLKLVRGIKELKDIINVWLAHFFNKEDIDIEEILEGGTQMLETLFNELHEKGVQEGKLEGREKGILEGKEKGILEGKEKGILEGIIKVAKNLFKKGFSIEEVKDMTGLSEEDLKKLKI